MAKPKPNETNNNKNIKNHKLLTFFMIDTKDKRQKTQTKIKSRLEFRFKRVKSQQLSWTEMLKLWCCLLSVKISEIFSCCELFEHVKIDIKNKTAFYILRILHLTVLNSKFKHLVFIFYYFFSCSKFKTPNSKRDLSFSVKSFESLYKKGNSVCLFYVKIYMVFHVLALYYTIYLISWSHFYFLLIRSPTSIYIHVRRM